MSSFSDQVTDYLSNLSQEELLKVLLDARGDEEITVSAHGYYVWESEVAEKFSEEKEDKLPEWLNASKKHHVDFYRQMTGKGYEVTRYRGRGFYDGPGVTVARYEMDEAVRACSVELQRDNMGLDYIIYPNN